MQSVTSDLIVRLILLRRFFLLRTHGYLELFGSWRGVDSYRFRLHSARALVRSPRVDWLALPLDPFGKCGLPVEKDQVCYHIFLVLYRPRPQASFGQISRVADVSDGVGSADDRLPFTKSIRRAAAIVAGSCSQIRMTVQPSLSSCRVVSRSRSRFFRIFAFHQSALAFGQVACFGHPCQKHPSIKTANLIREKAISIVRRRKPFTGTATRYLSPARCSAWRIASSGPVSLRRCRCMRPLTLAVLGTGLAGMSSLVEA